MRLVRSFAIGTLFCLTPVTALIALGWLMRRMRYVAHRRVGLPADRPTWFFAPASGGVAAWLGGLAANIRAGLSAGLSLALASLPFGVIWTLAWWAGWENSFGKGYEQSWVGPTLGVTGVAVFCLIMIWLPMALAHQAVENRALALFDWRRVASAVRHSGWGYVALSAATVILALPLFAARGLIAFAGGFAPLEAMTPDQVASLKDMIALAKAAYIFVALVILRGWAARLYAVAVTRAAVGPDAELWQQTPLASADPEGGRGWRLTHWMRLAILPVIWFGLVAQIFVAQFLNHTWVLWTLHPLVSLPFLP